MSGFQQRKKLRLAEFDYGSVGAYFVTVCTHNRQCVFGACENGVVELSELGRSVQAEWMQSAEIRNEIELDQYVVMPNHFHGIVWIREAVSSERKSTERTLGTLMAGFKSACTKKFRESAGADAALWQRRFYDHVIRNEQSLLKIREYVVNNPLRWDEDPENPGPLL